MQESLRFERKCRRVDFPAGNAWDDIQLMIAPLVVGDASPYAFCGTMQAPRETSHTHVLHMASPWGLGYRIVCIDRFSLCFLSL